MLRKNMEGGKGTGVKGRAVSDFKLGGQKVPRRGDTPARSWRPRRRARQTTREDPHEEMEQVQMLRGRSLASLRRFSKGRSVVTWSHEVRENQGGNRGQPAEGPGGLWLQAERGATDGFGCEWRGLTSFAQASPAAVGRSRSGGTRLKRGDH